MAKQLRIELKNGTIIVLDVSDNDRPETRLSKQTRYIRLQRAVFQKVDDILDVQEAGGTLNTALNDVKKSTSKSH